MIIDRDPGDEMPDFPLASEAKASAPIALIGTVGTVSQAALERVIREQAQAQSDHHGI